ncbi:MAG: hypothetical protein EA397_02655, partial [Deltaproteobacteria bacterium]
DTDTDVDTDTDTDVDTDTDTDVDTDIFPPDLRFRPILVDAFGQFAYDADFDDMGPWIRDGEELPSYVVLEFIDERFFEAGDNAWRCEVLLIPQETYVMSLFFSVEGPYRGFASQVFDHLYFPLWAGEFDAYNLPDTSDDSNPKPGCFDISEDPERDFHPDFVDEDFEGWLSSRTWAVGIGTMSHAVEDYLLDLPPDSVARELYTSGHLAGGAFLYDDDEGTLVAPEGFARGFAVTSTMELVVVDDSNVLHPADSIHSTEGGARPLSGIYEVYSVFGLFFPYDDE